MDTKIGRRIFYDKLTGNVLTDTGERLGAVIETTVEQDIAVYAVLSERNRDTFDYIKLEYGQYAQDFAECNGFRVNPVTKVIEFSYPDPNIPEQPLVFQKPLSEQIKELEQRTIATQEAVDFLLMGGI